MRIRRSTVLRVLAMMGLVLGFLGIMSSSPASAQVPTSCQYIFNSDGSVDIGNTSPSQQACAELFANTPAGQGCQVTDSNGDGIPESVQGGPGCTFQVSAGAGVCQIKDDNGDGIIEVIQGKCFPPQPTEPPVTPTETPVTPTETPVTPTETPVTPTETPVTPTETPVTPTETPVTPTETPVTPTETPTTPTETPGTPTETPGTPTETPGTPTETPGTPTETPGTPTETPGTPTETPGTPTETPGTPTKTPDDKPTKTPHDKPTKTPDHDGDKGDKTATATATKVVVTELPPTGHGPSNGTGALLGAVLGGLSLLLLTSGLMVHRRNTA